MYSTSIHFLMVFALSLDRSHPDRKDIFHALSIPSPFFPLPLISSCLKLPRSVFFFSFGTDCGDAEW